MTNRTFQQYAMGYGSQPAQVTCEINGNVVYSGAVTTFDRPFPTLPDPDFFTTVGWTWQNAADFEGTQNFIVSVTGADLLLAQTLANNPLAYPTDLFSSFYQQQIDGVSYEDPFTAESIDGVAQSGPFQPSEPGQWWWRIPAGSTFSANLHIIACVAQPAPYIEFDSVPTTIQAGTSGTFTLTIPNVDPDFPLPQTYGWKIQNLLPTTPADFQEFSGTVSFNTSTASFTIDTVAQPPAPMAKTFRAEIYRLTPGNTIVTSSLVTIV